jgi:hypothetical protein
MQNKNIYEKKTKSITSGYKVIQILAKSFCNGLRNFVCDKYALILMSLIKSTFMLIPI